MLEDILSYETSQLIMPSLVSLLTLWYPDLTDIWTSALLDYLCGSLPSLEPWVHKALPWSSPKFKGLFTAIPVIKSYPVHHLLHINCWKTINSNYPSFMIPRRYNKTIVSNILNNVFIDVIGIIPNPSVAVRKGMSYSHLTKPLHNS
jgi:hypothetical protein